MSAIKLLGAHSANQSTAGNTGPVPGTQDVIHRVTPGGVPLVNLPGEIGVLEPLSRMLGGGNHPESIATSMPTNIAVPGLDRVGAPLERASDSVRGAFGGLRPRLGSTVAPGPAGGVAQLRSRARGWLRRVGLATAPGSPNVNPGGPMIGERWIGRGIAAVPGDPNLNPGGTIRPVL